eukprot:GHVN01008432.1.p2 GENE.GHVN01008432.1~~GHVN01008432.1.p2  ORF type:complete len:200 (-),score=40.26 GHVN01008432.1:622-1221(-)
MTPEAKLSSSKAPQARKGKEKQKEPPVQGAANNTPAVKGEMTKEPPVQGAANNTPVVKGEMTTLELPNGGKYEGMCVNGVPEGEGKHTTPDGEIYQGMWLDGKRSGKGKCTFAPTGSGTPAVYEGDWLNDECDGEGQFTHSDGSVYRGLWKGGTPNGKGKHTAQGRSYEGMFVNGERHGVGVYKGQGGEVYTVAKITWK